MAASPLLSPSLWQAHHSGLQSGMPLRSVSAPRTTRSFLDGADNSSSPTRATAWGRDDGWSSPMSPVTRRTSGPGPFSRSPPAAVRISGASPPMTAPTLFRHPQPRQLPGALTGGFASCRDDVPGFRATVSTSPRPARERGSSTPLVASANTTPTAGGAFLPPSRASTTVSSQDWENEAERIEDIFGRIDTNRDGQVSRLEFHSAVMKDPAVEAFVLTGVDPKLMANAELSFDAIDSVFSAVAGDRQRFRLPEFESYFSKVRAEKTPQSTRIRMIFEKIDADSDGSISKLELISALKNDRSVDEFVGVDGTKVMNDEILFDTVDSIFKAIAGGQKRIAYNEFDRHFRKQEELGSRLDMTTASNRAAVRVFVIAAGFGREAFPAQGHIIEQAGFQVHVCSSVPDPGRSTFFPVNGYLHNIKAELNQFQPDVLVAASVGGAYAVGLWEANLWRGPTVLINAHPSCKRLPPNVPVVVTHGSNDDVFRRTREELEQMLATGSPNRCFLFYTGNSGPLASGNYSRLGDSHHMASLLSYDCLPRLIDAALAPEGPELHMVRSWRQRLNDRRLVAEEWLGYVPGELRSEVSYAHRGKPGAPVLRPVRPGSQEFQQVVTVFKNGGREQSTYSLKPQAAWDAIRVVRIERIENALQDENSVKPYYNCLKKCLREQGIELEPGVHTCWAFHGAGADAGAIESIITNPVSGFQPLASGFRNNTVWGCGTYFARDAQYVAEGGFCGTPGRGVELQMLMCLLATGIPCLGDPRHRGLLPFRRNPYRYNSSVDSLSSPEVYSMQHPGAAAPAYLITFA